MWERADLRGHEPCKVCTPGDAGKSQGILIFFSFGPKKEKKNLSGVLGLLDSPENLANPANTMNVVRM